MNKEQVTKVLKQLEIRPETISFYSGIDGDETETHVGTCDLSGLKGSVVTCTALATDGTVAEFDAGDWLIGGALGQLAGAF